MKPANAQFKAAGDFPRPCFCEHVVRLAVVLSVCSSSHSSNHSVQATAGCAADLFRVVRSAAPDFTVMPLILVDAVRALSAFWCWRLVRVCAEEAHQCLDLVGVRFACVRRPAGSVDSPDSGITLRCTRTGAIAGQFARFCFSRCVHFIPSVCDQRSRQSVSLIR